MASSGGTEPVETLVERVQQALSDADAGREFGFSDAWDALTELVERLTAAERERDVALRVIAAYDAPGGLGEVFAAVAVHFVEPAERRAEGAEARVAALEEALRAIADGKDKSNSVGFRAGEAGLRQIARAALRVEGDA